MAKKNTKVTKGQPDAATVLVRALDPIRADGMDYAPGEVFELGEADATALVDGGWAELARDDPAELSLTPK